MIQDYFLQFSDAQAVTSSAASTNVIDCGVANANLGATGQLWLVVSVNTTFTGATSMTVALQDDAAEDGTYANLVASEDYAEASLTKGTKLLCVPLPLEHARYLRVYYTVTGTHGAGAVDAFFTMTPQGK